MAFPTTLTNAVDGVTEIIAAHLNSLEAKVGVDGSAVATSLDYLVSHLRTDLNARYSMVLFVGDPSYPTFAAAIATLNAAGTSASLILPAGTHTVSADLTVNKNINLIPLDGALMSIATAKTLAINGPLEAGLYQIFSCAGTGKVTFDDGVVKEVYPEWWAANAIPGTTDMTAAVQAATIAHPVVKFQSAIYRLTAPIEVGKGLLTGIEPGPMTTGSTNPPAVNPGTWLFLDHTGRGITMTTQHGSFVEKFGTYRTQPTPSSSYPVAWTPTAHDYDIYTADKYDITIRDLVLLNPTKAIYAGGTVGGGRINITNIKGQPFQKGIVIEQCWDIVKIDQIHFWPFWGLSNFGSIATNQNKNIKDYTTANLDTIHTYKNDGPRLTNIFSIYTRAGIRFSENAYGLTQLFQATNLYFDFSKYGIWVDNTCVSANSSNGQLTNFVYSGYGVSGGKGIFCEGKCYFFGVGMYFQNSGRQMIHTTVTAARIDINDMKLYNFDTDGAGVYGIDPANGSIITLTGNITMSPTGGGGLGKYGTTGIVYVDDWRNFDPVLVSTVGTVTAWGTVTGKFRMTPGKVEVTISGVITTNGTADGGISCALPLGTQASGTWIGVGRETTVTGKMLQAYIFDGSFIALIYNYDNSFPGNRSNGATVVSTFTYGIAV